MRQLLLKWRIPYWDYMGTPNEACSGEKMRMKNEDMVLWSVCSYPWGDEMDHHDSTASSAQYSADQWAGEQGEISQLQSLAPKLMYSSDLSI